MMESVFAEALGLLSVELLYAAGDCQDMPSRALLIAIGEALERIVELMRTAG